MKKLSFKRSIIYFKNHFILGVEYALYFMGISALMGFIYGAFGGVWVAPAFVAVSYVGIIAVINFVFALLSGVINIIITSFGRGSKRLFRYFTFSLAFLVIYLIYFALLKYTGVQIF